jgi:glutathione S-transferase
MMLDRKGIDYKRVDLLPVISKGALRALGFPGVTVPALKFDGERVQGSRDIARLLDRVQPEPPLLPADPDRRAQVEEAERWGDEALQPVARRILWNGMRRDRSPLRSYSEGARLGVPIGLAVRTAAPIVALSARFNAAPTTASARTSRRYRRCSNGSTAGSRTGCSEATHRTPPTSRSRRASGC